MSKHSRGGLLDGLTDQGFVGEEVVEKVEHKNVDEMRPHVSQERSERESEEAYLEEGKKQIEWMYNKDYDKTNEASLEEYLVGSKSIEKLARGGDLIDNDYKMMQEQKKAGALFLHSENRHHTENTTADPMVKIKHDQLMRMKMYLQNPELFQKELEKRNKEKSKDKKKDKKERKERKREKKEKKKKEKKEKKDKKRKDYSSDSSYTSYSSDDKAPKKLKVDNEKSTETSVKEKKELPQEQHRNTSSSNSKQERRFKEDKHEYEKEKYMRDFDGRGGYSEESRNRSYRRDYDRDYRDDRGYRGYDNRDNRGYYGRSGYRDYDSRDYYSSDYDRDYDERDQPSRSKNENIYSKEDNQKQLEQMLKDGQQREQQKQEFKIKSLKEKGEILESAPQSIHNEKATFLQKTRKDTYQNKSFNRRLFIKAFVRLNQSLPQQSLLQGLGYFL